MSDMENLNAERYECPECGLPFDADGPDGLIPHALEVHPFSDLSQQIDEYLLLGLLDE